MALPHNTSVVDGTMRLSIWDFVAAGDELPTHSHESDAIHYSVLAAGRATMVCDGTAIEMVPGKLYKLLERQPHSFKAASPARIINILYGVP